MHLVQILLPTRDNSGRPLARELFAQVRAELVARHAGLTAYTRAPAEGLWDDGAGVERDDVVVYEVMVPALDRAWWAAWGADVARRFGQQELVVRALAMQRL